MTGTGQAEVLGQSVSVRGEAKDPANVRVLLRPEQLTLTNSSGNSINSATVTSLAFLGPLTRVSVRNNGDQSSMFVALPSSEAAAYVVGSQVDIRVNAVQALVE
ncbi:MAG: TOBE domain-containing protein [Actinobacteria bacterium]|nr:TOBE domain-containing protein [Actinomycetota bacterium]